MNKNLVDKDLKLVEELVSKYKETNLQISNVIVGQEQAIHQILSTIFVGGHSLLIGVPGLAKTLLVKTIAKILGLNFNRIQFFQNFFQSSLIQFLIISDDDIQPKHIS